MRGEDDVKHPMGEMLWDADTGLRIAPARVESAFPNAFRMARYPDGSMTLQGAYSWSQGDIGGIFWRDIPLVDVDELGNEIVHYEAPR